MDREKNYQLGLGKRITKLRKSVLGSVTVHSNQVNDFGFVGCVCDTCEEFP